ncbi:LuxR C-terminal-related transcriptional regulator [Micromonospora sp. DSM 115977]|uniref:LuxR C-terminal-related transcriptional regulator n=1 Tax=Micromonospora reichwaldensis TaxID=3075516 RepID=A0ABU2WR49_9ACTN|nr:AAA family ATPase [Micromonospora sp. DSM 115977]MDT0528099.1 LuxR C-terminal-related transcriptional regulator [Micromonospora sp. DSM 115977]
MQLTVLRGRADECAAIRRLLGDLPAGGGGLLVQGEPGSGRSALVDYAHRHAGGCTVLAGTGLPEEACLPYAGLQRLLDPVLDRAGALPGPHRRVLLRALTGAGCPADGRLALFLGVLGLLAAAARDRPLLCTMDDVDRGDQPTADALAFVARRLRRSSVAVLLTTAADVPLGGIARHRLRPLDDRDSAALLADRLAGRPPAPPVAAALAVAAGGNPQALVDLAEVLTPGQCRGEEPVPETSPPDGGLGRAYRARLDRLPADTRRVLLLAALDEDGEPATLVRAARVAGTAVEALAPAELAGLVRVEPRRVTFPQPLVRTVVRAAAPLAERRAAHLLLAGVLDGAGHRLRRAGHLAAAAQGPDPALAAELEQAVAECEGAGTAASVALQRAAELTDDPARAAARLVAAARYAWSAGRPHRARLLLGELPPGADAAVAGRADLLRGELELRTGRPRSAFTTLLSAADTLAAADRAATGTLAAADRAATGTLAAADRAATGTLAAADRAATGTVSAADRAATGTGGADDRALALGALVRAGEAACFTGDQYRYADVARRAELLRRPDDPPATELLSAYVAGTAATLRGDHEQAGPALRRAVVLGGQLTGPASTPAALTCAAAAGLLVAVDGAAHRLAERAVELARERGELSALPRALELRAAAEYWLGRHDAATDTSREGLRIARDVGQENWAGVHLGMLAVLAAVRADRDTALRRIREIGEDPGAHSRPRALAQWALAVLDLVDNRPAAAAARLAALACPGTGRGQVLVLVMATPYLVEAAATVADRPAASAALAVFDRWASSTASPSRRALSARCHGLLAPRGSAEAEREFRTALRLHPADAGAFERARTELLLGRELRRSRRPRAAREHLHAAREAFTLLGAATWAEQATTELRAAGESVGPPEESAARLLTGQQLRIARLVAEGATNREIAARMFLSTRTVDHHLRNIFHRLNIRSRTQLARALS